MRLNYKVRNDGSVPELTLYDVIGQDPWTGGGISAAGIRAELLALGNIAELQVRINSVGGDVMDGVAIYNGLKDLGKNGTRIVVTIDGAAMSIASVIMMAGDEIRAQENAVIMIHDPWTFAMGNAADMRKQAEVLDTIATTLVQTYVARTGQTAEKVIAWMAAETWWTAAEALAQKFVDVVLPNKSEPAAVSNRAIAKYKNVPRWVKAQAEPAQPRLAVARRRQLLAAGDDPDAKKPILCLDFDGVLHSYTSGWKGATTIPDPPVDGAAEFLAKAVKKFDVRVYSSRSGQKGGIDAMTTWLTDVLAKAGTPDVIDDIGWPETKPPASVTLDDRAITFDGKWPAIEDLLAFKPWFKKK